MGLCSLDLLQAILLSSFLHLEMLLQLESFKHLNFTGAGLKIACGAGAGNAAL